MRTTHRDVVAALIFSKDGKLLMGLKDPEGGGVYADCWHLPGGGAHKGETTMETLRRELLEELGLDISTHNIKLVDDQGRGESERTLPKSGEKVLCKMNFYVYRLDMEQNAQNITFQAEDDLKDLTWFEPKDLSGVKLTPPSITLFTRLGLV